MKNQYFISLICILFMYACDSGVSPSDKKTKKKVASIYLAETSFEDIFNGTLAEKENINVKNVYVAQSPILDTLNTNFSLNNIAAITYENLSNEERNNYDYIGVSIAQKNKENVPFSFSINTLEKINATKETIYQFAESISNASYKNLEPILATGLVPTQEAKTINDYFTETTASAGAIINYYYYGIGEGTHETSTYYTHMGTFVYGNGMTQNFHVNILEGDTQVKGYNINPLNIDPVDLK
ncbi:hypothetical protein [Dokdonia sp.]|uniref:hypothetical protein n=1 Tax=Dokdonia sp. TaxID=2024995 RepID=UPI0032677263